MRMLLPLITCATLIATCVPAQNLRNRIKPGRWKNKKDIPAGWVVHRTRHYEVQSQAGVDKAKRLGKHMESMLRLYSKMFRPDRSEFQMYAIKLFKDRESFIGYGASPSAGAFYNPVGKEMVCYDTGKWMDAPAGPTTGKLNAASYLKRYSMDILGAAAHEGWHQYFHWYVVSWVQLPSWVNEGMGDYFYCARPMKDPKTKKFKVELGRANHMRLPTVWRAVKDGNNVPVKRLLAMSKSEYYGNAAVCYAQGWALCQFLLHHKNKKYRKLIPVFIHIARDDSNFKKVTQRVFKGVDLDKLDEEFKAWVLGDGIAMIRGKEDKKGKKAGKGRG